jgi:hypothetical protein
MIINVSNDKINNKKQLSVNNKSNTIINIKTNINILENNIFNYFDNNRDERSIQNIEEFRHMVVEKNNLLNNYNKYEQNEQKKHIQQMKYLNTTMDNISDTILTSTKNMDVINLFLEI